ncbi:LuxR family transcriptional regulator [Pseudofrankia sp. BMG5.36]|uniref:AAA family ATPase n=1 Tax=Pseudofrankia sp. BMG5.36 TaxID=1834512 RepID=UPI0008DA9E84|nr:LuxR family transcriptional regulator [Pseudofrankia sp. BMG5.36]OHV73947.1 hypothetical protein BCD48_32925 [Pseudofrankia sp. BMG5.36]
MDVKQTDLVGRLDEVERLRSVLGETDGAASVLVSGPPGIGKSALLSRARELAAAAGRRLLYASPAAAEQALPFAALHDLLRPVLAEIRPLLPAPRARALDVALLRDDPPEDGQEQLGVYLAALTALELLAADGPLALVVDDAQWLDAPTAQALVFALRRFEAGLPLVTLLGVRATPPGSPVSVDGLIPVDRRLPIGGARPATLPPVVGPPASSAASLLADDALTDATMADDPWSLSAGRFMAPATQPSLAADLVRALPGSVTEIVVGPLDRLALADLVRARLGVATPAHVITLVHEASGGNPMFALEFLRAMAGSGAAATTGLALPVPESLRALVGQRLAGLPPGVRDVLLYAAAGGRLTTATLAQLTAVEGIGAAVATARDHEIVEVGDDGSLTFRHPLYATVLYGSATGGERRRVHGRLASLGTQGDDYRARHLALAADEPDDLLAAELEAAAAGAAARGATWTAGELAQLALGLTPEPDPAASRRRALLAADQFLAAGDYPRAQTLLERLERTAPTAAEEAEAFVRLAEMTGHHDPARWVRRHKDLLARLSDDVPVSADLRAGLARTLFLAGEPEASVLECARAAAVASRHGLGAVHVAMLTWQSMVEGFLGKPSADETLARAQAAAAAGPRMMVHIYRPDVIAAWRQLFRGDADDACRRIRVLLVEAEADGDYDSLPLLNHFLIEAAVRAGRLDEADRAVRAAERWWPGPEPGHWWWWVAALAAAARGDLRWARSAAARGVEGARSNGDQFLLIPALAVSGLVELLDADPAAALLSLRQARDLGASMGLHEPGMWPWYGDFVEAALACGQTDEAAAVAALLREQATALERPASRALADRCDAMILAARGQLGEAGALLDAVVAQAAEPRLERARSSLVAGAVARRARRKAAARGHLEHAAAEFAAMGARGWHDRTVAELGRVGLRTAPTHLTVTEQRVAELAAAGRTNRETADTLFMSVKTVEANLSRVYRKLQVRGRTELARRLTDQPGPDL